MSTLAALFKKENQRVSWEYNAKGTLIKALLKMVLPDKIPDTNISWDILILKS